MGWGVAQWDAPAQHERGLGLSPRPDLTTNLYLECMKDSYYAVKKKGQKTLISNEKVLFINYQGNAN